MIVELNYWDRVSYTSPHSEMKRQENIEADAEIDIFEKFYKQVLLLPTINKNEN